MDDHQLDVPFACANVRMMDYVLPRKLNLDGKWAKLHRLRKRSGNGGSGRGRVEVGLGIVCAMAVVDE